MYILKLFFAISKNKFNILQKGKSGLYILIKQTYMYNFFEICTTF